MGKSIPDSTPESGHCLVILDNLITKEIQRSISSHTSGKKIFHTRLNLQGSVFTMLNELAINFTADNEFKVFVSYW